MFLAVISPPASDRLASIQARLNDCGLTIDRVLGVLGKDLDAKWTKEKVDQRSARIHQGAPLTNGQLGCYVGHRLAWEAAYASESEWAVVFEDDAVPSALLGRSLEHLSAISCQEPTIVTFLSTGRHAFQRRQEPVELAPGVILRKLRWPPNSAVSYAMNRAAMKWRLDHEKKISSSADWPPWAADVAFWATTPWLVEHADGASIIGAAGPVGRGALNLNLDKALWVRFLAAPRPYGWSPVRYWKHAYAPALVEARPRLAALVARARSRRP